MTIFGKESLATVLFSLQWTDGNVRYEDCFLARRINAWRDMFMPKMEAALAGQEEGATVRCVYAPGELVPGHDLRKVLQVARGRLSGKAPGGDVLSPRFGRFYPIGLFSGITGVFPSSFAPARIIALNGTSLTVDMNHPLANRAATLDATILRLQQNPSETGGRLSHWGEELCNYGPGMQSPLPGQPTDFTGPSFFDRDDTDDAAFYAAPRIINHVDAQAHANLNAFHDSLIPCGAKVLDLMSSSQTHLSEEWTGEVVGVGMNAEEMESNPRLDAFHVHDLNKTPELPVTGPFDAVLLSLSLEYLTDPLAVLRSAYDVLGPTGVIVVDISDRWFPTKTVRGWLELHPFERVGFAHSLLEQAGCAGEKGAKSMRNDWRPTTDRHFLSTRGISDPVHAVWAFKA